MKQSDEGEFLPGSDRKRERYGTMPMLAGEMVGSVAMASAEGRELSKPAFPFISWAHTAQFRFPEGARDFLAGVESAPEAFYARAFVARGGITYSDGAAVYVDGTRFRRQVRHGFLRVDFVVERGPVKIAVEVDGFTFHSKYDQMAADYLRARRLVALGYILIRFTAQEVFASAEECWKQTDAVLAAHLKGR